MPDLTFLVFASRTMHPGEEKKKSRPKDVFGRALPTEEQFDVLKNAPRFVQIFCYWFVVGI